MTPPSMDLVVLVGLPGAGKSTFYRSSFAGSHAHVSRDLLGRGRDSRRRQRRRIEEALGRRQSVVVDNTNATPEVRAELIALGRAAGAALVCYFFEPDLPGSLERNARRSGRARVPQVAVHATAKRLVPPSRAEGFDRIYRVRALEGGRFHVEEAS